jgi:hypothetical protein
LIHTNHHRQCRRQTGAASLARKAVQISVGVMALASGACTNATLDLFDPDLGLLAHWALDEAQPGNTAVDSSGFGNQGTPSAGPPTPTPDVPPVHFRDRYSLAFNGKDQWIEMGNPPILNLGGPISLAAWVRPTTLDDYRNVLAHGYRWEPSYNLALRIYSGAYQFTYWDSADHMASAPARPEDLGSWVHLCGVFDGTSYYVYRNGVLLASNPDSTVPVASIDAIWAIGARAPQPTGGANYLLQGQIDDVRIYGRALSSAEVQALYQR